MLLLVNFLGRFKLDLMYTSIIENIRSSFIYLHNFQLLVLLPYFIEITFFLCTKGENLLTQKFRQTSNRLSKGFLKLSNLHVLIKQKSLLLRRNFALVTSGKLLIVFSTQVNLLYVLYSTIQRCCLLHLIKQSCLLKNFLCTLILMTQVSVYLFSLVELI